MAKLQPEPIAGARPGAHRGQFSRGESPKFWRSFGLLAESCTRLRAVLRDWQEIAKKKPRRATTEALSISLCGCEPANGDTWRQPDATKKTYHTRRSQRNPQNLDTISELQISNQWRAQVKQTRAFDRESGQWLCWQESNTGGLWVRDSDLVTREHTEILGQLLDFASANIPEKKDQAPEIAAAKLRSRWEVRRVVYGSLQFSKDHLTKDAGEHFDRTPAIVGLSNGAVIDLRTGKTRPGTPADRLTITLQDGVVPDQVTPTRWLQFVSELLGNYPEDDRMAIEDWLQRAAGYSLAAETEAEILPFLHGPPGTGKSTFIETLSWIAGKHHCGLPADALASSMPTHRQWLARLRGRRLATLTETASDAAWKSSSCLALCPARWWWQTT